MGISVEPVRGVAGVCSDTKPVPCTGPEEPQAGRKEALQ